MTHLGGPRSARCSSASTHVREPCPDVHCWAPLTAFAQLQGPKQTPHKPTPVCSCELSHKCIASRAGCQHLPPVQGSNHDDEHAFIRAGGAGVCPAALPALLCGRGAGGRNAAHRHPAQKRGFKHEHAATQRCHAWQVRCNLGAHAASADSASSAVQHAFCYMTLQCAHRDNPSHASAARHAPDGRCGHG